MVYTLACPVAEVAHKLESEREKNFGSSTTVTAEILNNFFKSERHEEKQNHNS
jgi:hypothetical protein